MSSSDLGTAPPVERLVADLAERFEWPDWSGFDIAETWESRTAILYKLHPRNGAKPRVLKIGTRWTPAKAREVYEDLVHNQKVFGSSDSVRLHIPAPFGWHDTPPCVCVEFVPGNDLSRLLSSRSAGDWADLDRVVLECGAALGSFHSSYSFDPDLPEAPMSRARLDAMVQRMARLVAVDAGLVAGIDWSRLASRRYGDFAPYNLRVDEQGRIWVLDQPSGRSYAPVHRDVAYFLDRVDRLLGRDQDRDQTVRWESRARLERALLDGYRATGPGALDQPQDKTLMALYLTHKQIHTARKRLRRGRPQDIPHFLRIALEWRRRASTSSFAGA